MASPNGVNLAAKLFALNPSAHPGPGDPPDTRGGSASPDGRRELIDERESVRLLKDG